WEGGGGGGVVRIVESHAIVGASMPQSLRVCALAFGLTGILFCASNSSEAQQKVFPQKALQKKAVVFDPDLLPQPIRQECGLVLTPQQAAQYLAHRPTGIPPDSRGGPPYFVAIAPHIVRRTDGSEGLPVSRYEQSIIDSNLAYTDTGIVFYTAGAIDFIDSDAFYFNIDSVAEIDALRTTNTVPNAINIYFTLNLKTSPSNPICGISAFTFSDVQAIAVANACTATPENHSTVPHEIGHYFDLFHTHETAFGEEFVDGSNCFDAGDLLCDTPADPVLTSATVDSVTCAYEGNEIDSNGDHYDPDTHQFLSYSRKHCRDAFSPGSEAKIVETLLGPRANLISPATSAGILDTAPTADSPISLSAPRPNPTKGDAVLELTLADAGVAEIAIYDVRGSLVRGLSRGVFEPGQHVAHWDGLDDEGRVAAPGFYFVRAQSNGAIAIQKLQIVR
ncbi:MAG TPA: FlgD immunoglobulin-like domain containing protein, partial [bacterium]|nr:FlgD immunoglobulin-like domain containing protein [bacterium]